MRQTTTLLLSVLLAFAVWLIAIDQENPLLRQEYEQPILIEVRNMGEGLQSLQDLTSRTAMLTLRAPQRTLASQQADDFSAVIDLADLPEGSHEVQVDVTALNPDVEIIAHEPRQLRVQLEPVISKVVEVEVEVMDSAAFGYDWQEPLAEPAEVEISGPRTQVEQVRSVIAAVFLRNAKSQVEQNRPLSPRNVQNLEVDRVKVEPGTARIVVHVVQPTRAQRGGRARRCERLACAKLPADRCEGRAADGCSAWQPRARCAKFPVMWRRRRSSLRAQSERCGSNFPWSCRRTSQRLRTVSLSRSAWPRWRAA